MIAALEAFTSLMLLMASLPPAGFEGAEGFGAVSRGGAGGRVLVVDSLDDHPAAPAPGTLRWAIQQPGPRIVTFQVAGVLRLQGELVVTEPYLTLDGSSAPAGGVCLRDHSMEIRNTHDVIVRHLRFRLGDVEVLKRVTAEGRDRPQGSGDLDCVGLRNARNILFDHCSLSWSCDELFGIVGCENVTIQWCLMAEPLANPKVHPYGDRHAYGLNISASSLTMHHCLLAHYVMRGPQFEANDVRRSQSYPVQMEAINNVMFDYERSGARYTAGIEDHPEEAAQTRFEFQFVNNLFLGDDQRPEILCTPKHGAIDRLRVFVSGNRGPHRPDDSVDDLALLFVEPRLPMRDAPDNLRSQLSDRPLFKPPHPVTVETAEQAFHKVLDEAGAGPERDAVDSRIVDNVRQRRLTGPIQSQADVGGWPDLVKRPAGSDRQ